MTTTAIIVAAGRGTRAGGELPKQWQTLRGVPVAVHALRAFATHPGVDALVLVLHPDDIAAGRAPADPPCIVVTGGEERHASVLAGLLACPPGTDKVLIHDAARPGVSAQIIDAVLAALADHKAAAPALPVSDALWRGENGKVTGTQDRTGLFRAQTPQGFDHAAILAAHRAHPGLAADDVEVARAAGLEVVIVPGHEDNLKITYPDDFRRAERIVGQEQRLGTAMGTAMDIRLGNGYDVHRFCAGDHVTLCGVKVPHERALDGHSDADVGMHAVTDALYGALAMGDIGRHFPPSDPQWKGAASEIFLKHAAELARDMGFAIGNVDCTLVCERPKIGPHAAAMQARMADILGIEAGRVSVKATTSERLGFTGREEGIAALATATLVKT